ncbi:MAG: type IV secretion system DNA-binding domain-containing protein [Steroidobacteraceae bacterium]
MLNDMTHGALGLLFAYVLTLIGVAIGQRLRRRSSLRSLPQALLFALAALIVGAVLWAVIHRLDLLGLGKLRGTPLELLGMAFMLLVGLLTGLIGHLVLPQPLGATLHRGTRLVDREPAPAHRPHGRETASALTLAGHPIPSTDETKHFKLLGTTGTGKSTAIRELLRGALARGDRAVIADPDGSYLNAFYDPARGDVILNPFDSRAARWDLLAEIVQLHDADQLARSIIPDYDGTDRSWRHYARIFLTAILRQLHRLEDHDLAKLYWLLCIAPPAELRELLAATPAGPFLGEDNGKFFESVRSITTVHIAALEHIARQETGEPLSVRRWVREGRGVLFLPYRAGEIAVLRYVVSTWMRLALFETMNAPEGDQRLWFIVDELDALGAIDGLKDALARLRKFGGRCVLGFQSIAQVRGTYGDAEAQTLVENCGNTLILRCSASERGGTAEFASRLIGEREIIRPQITVSRPMRLGGSLLAQRTLSREHVVEDAVLASEIEQLPDLTGLLKLASQPEWRRITLSRTASVLDSFSGQDDHAL